MEKNVKRRKQSFDRLSFLPVDILIRIISLLPLRLAIVTGSLSRQWRGLWTNVTSINISSHELKQFPEFMKHITSPSIDCLTIELFDLTKKSISIWPSPVDTWLQQACDRNVRELKFAHCTFLGYDRPKLPRFIFQMQSLVSLELFWFTQYPGQVNLPNLKRLWLKEFPFSCWLLEVLMKGSPSLEDLILEFSHFNIFQRDIKIFSRKLRRLVINTNHIANLIVVINAPKLEQFVTARTSKCVIFRFEEKPCSLSEAIINISGWNKHLSEDENRAMSGFYGAISNARFVTLDAFVLDNVSTVFRNAKRLTLSMKWCHSIETVLSSIDLCPLLDDLTLDLLDISREDPTLAKPGQIRTSRRVLKRIQINGGWYYHKFAESFLKLVRYLLSGAIGLEHFHLKLSCPELFSKKSYLKARQREELNLCKLLCKYYMASKEFEVEFVGMFHKYVSNGRSKRSTSRR